jgi:enediyne biosynthesis protein E4
VNNDGRPDVLVTLVGGARLFLNQGRGVFRDATKEAGLDNPAWGASAAFLDFDRDGRLDLVVVNYVDFDPSWRCKSRGKWDYCSPNVFPPVISRLFRNTGEKKGVVQFKEVTMSSGLGKVPGPGLGVYCADFDGDGWTDIFVANDGKPNHLWVNQKNGTFKEEAVQRGLAYDGMGRAQAGMGVALADVDGDGLLDVFVTHLTEEQHTLWKQGPRGLYTDRSTQARLSSPGWRSTGFGTALLDIDNDGWPDLVIANGRAARGPAVGPSPLGEHWGPYGERNQVFANDGAGRFKDISRSNPALCGQPNVARGLAVGDIDGDGGLDIVLTTAGGRARVLRNKAADRGHWLKVRALDRDGKRDALGAEVTVLTPGRRHIRILQTAESYLCASEAAVHVGLGKEQRYEGVEVLWPDGQRECFAGGKADCLRPLRQGSGKRMEAPRKNKL